MTIELIVRYTPGEARGERRLPAIAMKESRCYDAQ